MPRGWTCKALKVNILPDNTSALGDKIVDGTSSCGLLMMRGSCGCQGVQGTDWLCFTLCKGEGGQGETQLTNINDDELP